jgi:hypothetical protein
VDSGNYDCLGDDEKSCRGLSAWIERDHRYHRKQQQDESDLWTSDPSETEGMFNLQVQANDRLRYCFESKVEEVPATAAAREDEEETADDDATRTQDHVIGFMVRMQCSARTLPDEELGPDAKRALEIVDMASDMQGHFQNLLDHFDFMRNREAVHVQLTNQINDRVMGWTIIEAILVITMAFAQVWYWKAFFERRRYL